jgi:hypothetical protein
MSDRQAGFAALAAWACAATWFLAGGIYAVLTAQALSPDAGDEDPHIAGGEFGQALAAQFGDQVEADHTLVSLVGARLPFGPDHMLQPVREVLLNGPALGRYRDALVGLLQEPG